MKKDEDNESTNAREAAFCDEAWKYPMSGFERSLWEWPEMAGINDSIHESKRRIAAYEAGVDAIRLANKVVNETLESISGAGAALISRASLRDVEPENCGPSPKQSPHHVDRNAINAWLQEMASRQDVTHVRDYGRLGAAYMKTGFEPVPTKARWILLDGSPNNEPACR